MRLVESVLLDQLANRGDLRLLQHHCAGLLQGGVHLEVKLRGLVSSVVDHLIRARGDVAGVGARVVRRQGRLHFLRVLYLLQEVVHVQHQYQLPLRVALLEELVLPDGRLVAEDIREQQAQVAVELAVWQVLNLHVHFALLLQEVDREFLRDLEEQVVEDAQDAGWVAFYESKGGVR